MFVVLKQKGSGHSEVTVNLIYSPVCHISVSEYAAASLDFILHVVCIQIAFLFSWQPTLHCILGQQIRHVLSMIITAL